MSYDNTNRGALFKNDRKETDKHPDYTGKINVNGEEFKIAGWIKDGKKGKFMSLAISTPQEMAPEKRTSSGNAAEQAAAGAESDIPFMKLSNTVYW